jgi:hypothetical protein
MALELSCSLRASYFLLSLAIGVLVLTLHLSFITSAIEMDPSGPVELPLAALGTSRTFRSLAWGLEHASWCASQRVPVETAHLPWDTSDPAIKSIPDGTRVAVWSIGRGNYFKEAGVRVPHVHRHHTLKQSINLNSLSRQLISFLLSNVCSRRYLRQHFPSQLGR